ncbi:MAG TPA: ABC transporter substrate-binding protein [Stellaceae bacterium]|nr:ABC transporter substrate-binding protein [Stellaceae bacterium]
MKQGNDKTSAPTRRKFLSTVAGSGAGLTLAGRARFARAAERAPIKIGFLNSFSKAFGQYGKSAFDGMNLYFDQIGWQSAGRKIEIVKEDDEINPQVGLEKARKLVESDKAQIICGPLYTPVGIAMLPYMAHVKTLWIVTGAGSVAASAAKMPYMFRTCWSTWQVAAPMGKYVYDHVAKAAVLISSDMNAGRDVIASFEKTFVPAGGKVIKEIYVAMGTNDFSSYLTDIRSMNPPAVYAFFGGTDSVRFVKQFAEFGLKDKSRLIGFQSLLDNDTLPAEGDAALGALSSTVYTASLDTPENRAFVAAYRKKYQVDPGIFAEVCYTTARIIDDALRATGGDVEDKDKFAAVVAATKITAPSGPFRFDPTNHLAIENVYILRADKIDGRMRNTVIETIADVRDPDSKGN